MRPALLALGALLVVLALLAPGFYAAENLRDLALSNVATLLTAAAVTLVIVTGNIDVSLGSMFAVTSVVVALAAQQGVPTVLLPLLALLVGTLLGALNATLVVNLRIPSIVATLATMVILREALRWRLGGAWIQSLPPSFQWLALGQDAGQVAILLLTALTFAVTAFVVHRLAAGQLLFAVGSNAESARLAGMNTNRVTFLAFTACGVLTGLAAWLNSVRFAEIPSNTGVGLEMKAIAAAVVGGAAITGGRANLAGTLAGAILMGTIGTALTYLRADAAWERAIQGVVILAAVLAASLLSQRRKVAHAR